MSMVKLWAKLIFVFQGSQKMHIRVPISQTEYFETVPDEWAHVRINPYGILLFGQFCLTNLIPPAALCPLCAQANPSHGRRWHEESSE